MERPCFLVIDREYAGNISTRKLVIETAKFNVITAYDGEEGVETLKRFPNVDGVVVNADLTDYDTCSGLIERLRKIAPQMDVIVTSHGGFPKRGPKVHYVDNFDPKSLLSCLESLKPEATAELRAREATAEPSIHVPKGTG